jgi:predicted O-methyltransferase YrrM
MRGTSACGGCVRAMSVTVTTVCVRGFRKSSGRRGWRLLDRLGGLRHELNFLIALRVLPPRVALFQWRARRLALRVGDQFSLVSATRPRDLAVLMGLARGRRYMAELGTGTAWTTISLALADRQRTVVSYDPIERSERDLYLELTKLSVRDRIALVVGSGIDVEHCHRMVDLLYIDSSHSREETVREVRAWEPFLTAGALLVFDDFTHPDYPGVREAITQLRLTGEQRGTLFVHRVRAEKAAHPFSPFIHRCASKSRRTL